MTSLNSEDAIVDFEVDKEEEEDVTESVSETDSMWPKGLKTVCKMASVRCGRTGSMVTPKDL